MHQMAPRWRQEYGSGGTGGQIINIWRELFKLACKWKPRYANPRYAGTRCTLISSKNLGVYRNMRHTVQLMGWNVFLKMVSYLHATEFNLLIPQCSCCNTQYEYFHFITSHEKEDNICSYKKDFNLMQYRIQILSVNCWALKLTRQIFQYKQLLNSRP